MHFSHKGEISNLFLQLQTMESLPQGHLFQAFYILSKHSEFKYAELTESQKKQVDALITCLAKALLENKSTTIGQLAKVWDALAKYEPVHISVLLPILNATTPSILAKAHPEEVWILWFTLAKQAPKVVMDIIPHLAALTTADVINKLKLSKIGLTLYAVTLFSLFSSVDLKDLRKNLAEQLLKRCKEENQTFNQLCYYAVFNKHFFHDGFDRLLPDYSKRSHELTSDISKTERDVYLHLVDVCDITGWTLKTQEFIEYSHVDFLVIVEGHPSIVVQLDGPSHFIQYETDMPTLANTLLLKNLGYLVVRIPYFIWDSHPCKSTYLMDEILACMHTTESTKSTDSEAIISPTLPTIDTLAFSPKAPSISLLPTTHLTPSDKIATSPKAMAPTGDGVLPKAKSALFLVPSQIRAHAGAGTLSIEKALTFKH